jgi:hypothetical protein
MSSKPSPLQNRDLNLSMLKQCYTQLFAAHPKYEQQKNVETNM